MVFDHWRWSGHVMPISLQIRFQLIRNLGLLQSRLSYQWPTSWFAKVDSLMSSFLLVVTLMFLLSIPKTLAIEEVRLLSTTSIDNAIPRAILFAIKPFFVIFFPQKSCRDSFRFQTIMSQACKSLGDYTLARWRTWVIL